MSFSFWNTIQEQASLENFQLGPPNRWRASSAYSCPRSQALNRLLVTPTNMKSGRSAAAAKWGSFSEEGFVELLGNSGLTFFTQVYVECPGWNSAGHIDILVPPQPKRNINRWIVADKKTVKSTAFKWQKEDLRTFKHRYWAQMTVYKVGLAFTYNLVGVEARILPLSKDDWFTSEVILSMEGYNTWMDILRDHYGYMNEMWNKKLLPECWCTESESWKLYIRNGSNRKDLYCNYATQDWASAGTCCFPGIEEHNDLP